MLVFVSCSCGSRREASEGLFVQQEAVPVAFYVSFHSASEGFFHVGIAAFYMESDVLSGWVRRSGCHHEAPGL
jgi:hypothetical protein